MLSVIIPSYNERKVIGKTIEAIQKVSKSYKIIVVDDNSPDKTSSFVKNNFPDVVCITRNEKGLSSAIERGFKAAKTKYVAVIDADGQHDERILPEMLKFAKTNDLVIGSRFVKGGSVEGWPKKRLLITRVSQMLVRPLVGKVKDPLAGFFIVRKEIVEDIHFIGNGYKILLEIIVKCKNIKEIPYKFEIRKEGDSKLNMKVVFEDLKTLLKLYFIKFEKFLKFCVVGLSGVIVNLCILYFLTEFAGVYHLYSAAIAIEFSIVTNFLLNDIWTWKGKKKYSFKQRLLRFNSISLFVAILNLIIYFILTKFGIYYLLSSLISIIFVTIINFFGNHCWTFKE